MVPANPSLVNAFAVSVVIITILVTLSSFLIRRAATKILETVDRVPSREWFDKVERALDDMPDKKRWEEHFTQNHKLWGEVEALKIHVNNARTDIARHEHWLNSLGRRKDDGGTT